jgi:hypothetical protein
MFDILPDDLTSEQTRSLLALHLSGMREDPLKVTYMRWT